jgi:hypothetical protein
MADARRPLKAGEIEEAARGPRRAAWLPEAEWEWHDRVHSSLWPCELPSARREKSPLSMPLAGNRGDNRD